MRLNNSWNANWLIRLMVGVLLCCGAPGKANAQPITGWTLRVYLQGAQAPVTPPVPLMLTCGQAPIAPPTGTVTNPTRVVADDPTTAGKGCIYTDSGSGPLFALPFGTVVYESTLTATNAVGTSAESARSNLFTHPGGLPSVPTGLRIARALFGWTSTVLGFHSKPVATSKPLFPRLVGDRRP